MRLRDASRAIVWPAVAVVVLAGVVVVVVVGRSLTSSDEAAGGGCSGSRVVDDQAGLCYVMPEGWGERSAPPEVEIPVSSMIGRDGDGGPATAMAGDWQEVFDAEPPGEGLEDAARWLVGESGLLGIRGTDVFSDETDLRGDDAATATTTTDTDPAIELRATVVEVADGKVSFLLTVAAESDDALASDVDDIHSSIAVAA